MSSLFDTDQNRIFATKEPFDDGFTPDELLECDDLIDQYVSALQDVVRGFGPSNIFVYGGSGLGKTALTEKMMEHLRTEAAQNDIPLTIISVNCNKHNSTYEVIRQLANGLTDDTYVQGHDYETLWNAIYTAMDDRGGDFIVILDEIDHLGTDDTLLYEFPRARAMGELENARVGIIGISNDHLYRDNLRDRVKSTLCETEIHFNPYKAGELATILDYYADIAFEPGVLTDEVVPLIAAITAKETGDVRTGLDLLEQAGNIARDAGTGTVTADHVEQARVAVEREDIHDVFVDNLTLQQQLLFLSVMALDLTQTDAPTFEHVYRQYEQYCETFGSDQLSQRHARNCLQTVDDRGLLHSEMHNVGENGGRWKSYTLTVSPTVIIDAIDTTESQFDMFLTDEIRNAAETFEYSA